MMDKNLYFLPFFEGFNKAKEIGIPIPALCECYRLTVQWAARIKNKGSEAYALASLP
jgi:hypothetical protein